MNKARVLVAVVFFLLVIGLPAFKPSAVSATSEVGLHADSRFRRFKLNVAAVDATSVRLHWQPQSGASEYEVMRNDHVVGRTVGMVGYFTDFGLQPGRRYQYTVRSYNDQGAVTGQSTFISARTTRSTQIRTHYTVLAIAFNPTQEPLITEAVYLKHRIQFLELASLRSAMINLYTGSIISTTVTPAVEPGSNWVDYIDLVTRRDLPELHGLAIVDLIERGDIDHVWVVKSPVDFMENVLIGNLPIDGITATMTWPPIPVKSSRSFFVNGYLPDQRSYDAYAHMVEGIMTTISSGHPELWPRNLPYEVYTTDRTSLATFPALLNVWERFRLADGWNGTSATAYASTGNSNMGSSHFPPTSSRECTDYCYFDIGTWRRYVDSTADGWLNFPLIGDQKRKINGYDFGAFNNYVQGQPSYVLGTSPEEHSSFHYGSASFHQWWFAHLPHNPGVSGGQLNTWWPYLFDFNRFNGSPITYRVKGFPSIETDAHPVKGEYGTEARSAKDWGYWHSENGFSQGGKAAELSIVGKADEPEGLKRGNHALKVVVENAQYWEVWGAGRNDVFYPVTRDAHWELPNLAKVRFSIKPGENASLIADTNPIVRLYTHGGQRIELVPRVDGAYANLFQNVALRDADGWYTFSIPLAGDATWEKNVIGYIDPALPEAERLAARTQLEREILADLNYVEISIRTTTSEFNAPYDVVTYLIDGLSLLEE